MKRTRLQKGIVITTVLLLLASLWGCQLAQTRLTPEVIAVTPTTTPGAPTQPSQAPTQPSQAPTQPPEAVVQPPSPAGVIVDNADPGFTIEAGDWGTCENGDCQGTPYGADFRFADPGCTSCRARFDFRVTTGGEYDVWAWWPWGEDRATDAPFTIIHNGSPFTVNVDLQNGGDAWWWLATLTFEPGESVSIVVEGTGTGFANADAVALTPAGSGLPGESVAEVPVTAATGAPVIQSFYSEASPAEGCYYLHWEVSDATEVHLDDEEVDSTSSTEVCPEETTDYNLWAENATGSVEQGVTIEIGAEASTDTSPTPSVQPAAPPGGPPSGADFRRVIFLHHSTGANLIEQGGVRQRLTALGYEFYDHGYNEDGLVLADGTWTGRNFNVPDDNTNPDGFAIIFAQPLDDPPDNTFSYLMQYDVIAFKSCFPVSLIESDAQLAEYQSYYLSIRDRMDQYPNKIFIVVTNPPEIPADSDAEMAARARAFTHWLASDEYLSGHPNVFTFDFFDLLANPSDNMLRAEYRTDEYDAHPDQVANQAIGPLFVDFIDQAVRTYSAR
jgi:hypothetical protein